MRIAVLILGLVLGALMFMQTFMVTALSGVANDADSGAAGSIGLVVAFMWLVACALVIPIPFVSAIVFALSGLLALGVSGDFPDMQIWGVVAFALAILSFIGWLGKRRGERKEAARHAELVSAMSIARATPAPAAGVACPACGGANTVGSRFCAACGAALATP